VDVQDGEVAVLTHVEATVLVGLDREIPRVDRDFERLGDQCTNDTKSALRHTPLALLQCLVQDMKFVFPIHTPPP